MAILNGWWSEGQFRTKPATTEWKASNFSKNVQNYCHLAIESVWEKRWINILTQVDFNNLSNHYEWSSSKLA